MIAVFRKPIIFKIWQNVIIENGNTDGYDIGSPGLWRQGELNRTRLTYLLTRDNAIEEAINAHLNSIENAIDRIKTKQIKSLDTDLFILT